MLVTLLPILTDAKPEQPEKALLPMLVTSSPRETSLIDVIPLNHEPTFLQSMDTVDKLEQPEKAPLPTLVTLLPIVIVDKAEQL